MSLSGQASIVDNRLVIAYKLVNEELCPVFVWDVMIDYNKDGQIVDPHLAYVAWEEPATLRVVRAMLELPPDRDVTKKEVPYVRKVASRASIEGTISLPLPVKEYSPFYPPAEKTKEVQCKKIVLLIGWIEEQPGMKATPRDAGGTPVLALKGTWKQPYQKLAEKSFDLTVPVLVRLDEFDRRRPMR